MPTEVLITPNSSFLLRAAFSLFSLVFRWSSSMPLTWSTNLPNKSVFSLVKNASVVPFQVTLNSFPSFSMCSISRTGISRTTIQCFLPKPLATKNFAILSETSTLATSIPFCFFFGGFSCSSESLDFFLLSLILHLSLIDFSINKLMH